MESIVLLPDFDMSEEEVRKLVADSYASGEDLNIEVPIEGQLYFTDTDFLASQFLHAAYIGQTLAGACAQFECEAPSSIDAHESVEFYVVPKDVDAFMEKFWEVAVGFMSEELLEHFGYSDISAAESRGEGWDLLEKPELATHTLDLVEHAQAILDILEEDEEEEDEDEDEEDDDKEED